MDTSGSQKVRQATREAGKTAEEIPVCVALTRSCDAENEKVPARASFLPSCRPLTAEKTLSLSCSFLLQKKKNLGFEVGLNEDFAFVALALVLTKHEGTKASPGCRPARTIRP